MFSFIYVTFKGVAHFDSIYIHFLLALNRKLRSLWIEIKRDPSTDSSLGVLVWPFLQSVWGLKFKHLVNLTVFMPDIQTEWTTERLIDWAAVWRGDLTSWVEAVTVSALAAARYSCLVWWRVIIGYVDYRSYLALSLWFGLIVKFVSGGSTHFVQSFVGYRWFVFWALPFNEIQSGPERAIVLLANILLIRGGYSLIAALIAVSYCYCCCPVCFFLRKVVTKKNNPEFHSNELWNIELL